MFTVARLMKENFFNNKEKDTIVHFKDKNPLNLELSNLSLEKREFVKQRSYIDRRCSTYVHCICLIVHLESQRIKMVYSLEELRRSLGLKYKKEAYEIFKKREYNDGEWYVKVMPTWGIDRKRSGKKI